MSEEIKKRTGKIINRKNLHVKLGTRNEATSLGVTKLNNRLFWCLLIA